MCIKGVSYTKYVYGGYNENEHRYQLEIIGIIMNSKNSLNSDALKTLYLKKSRFTEMLIEENALDQSGFERWLFCHGMLFNSPDK